MATIQVIDRNINDVIPTQAKREAWVAKQRERFDPANILADKLENRKTSTPTGDGK